MNQAARAAVDQREQGGNRGVRRRAEGEGLDESDPEREARLGIVRQALPRGAVDQLVEIGEAAQRLGRDGEGEAAIVGTIEVARRRIERGVERQALAQDRVEQPKGRSPGRRTLGIGLAQFGRLRVRGTETEAARMAAASPGVAMTAVSPISSAIASSAAIRLPVSGWVENRLSRPPLESPGTM